MSKASNYTEEFKRVRKLLAQRRAFNELRELLPSCPRCYEDVVHEDDHLVGDKAVNCWYECPGDERPVA